MSIFDVLTLIGGLCLFLFGMNIMGLALERRAGSKLQTILGKMTTNKFAGLFTGLGVTSIIQSSSATTVMVVGFVNSGLMTLKQAINVIMGANIGTTVTAWILSLGGIESDNLFVQLLKPTSFTPVLALIGIIFYMFCKSDKKKDTGMILLGFAVLMFGMDSMTNSVSDLADIPAFQNLFIMFKNPILGVFAGAILTAIIQSSSASVGILQALAMTGAVSYGAAIPIIMGQNIGTCITAILSSFGTNRNAKRAALVHLSFNIIGTVVWLTTFCIVNAIFAPALFGESASLSGIAVAHSAFNILCTIILLPMSSILEKLAYKLVPETKLPETYTELDERLLATPAVALERSHNVAIDMANVAFTSLKNSIECLKSYTPELAASVREDEDKTDHYEDIIGTYLVKLSSNQLSDHDSTEAAKLLKIIGDLERISDHAVTLIASAEEMNTKKLTFSKPAIAELNNLMNAVEKIIDLTASAFTDSDITSASKIEPLEQIIDKLRDNMRNSHIQRLQQGACSIETGFIWADILTNLERTSDHCSNIAGCVIDTKERSFNTHESSRALKTDNTEFKKQYSIYAAEYNVK
ncbi:MAG: Na/Pi cotransporter family protein [Ruminococcus sp.]|nr:Na/Pi cotransporter family protein [Ruminococcus sp.]